MLTKRMEGLIKTLILTGFTYVLFQLVSSGNIKYYINPKFVPLTIFTMVVTFLLATVQFMECLRRGKGSTHQHSKPGLELIVFVVPVMLGLLVPPAPLDVSLAQNKGITMPKAKSASNQENPTQQASAEKRGFVKPLSNEQIAEKLRNSQQIVIDENNFVVASSEIFEQPDLYQGKTIELTGFIYRDQTLKASQIALVRYMVSCCTSDATVVGFLAEANSDITYKDGAWLKVKGEISKVKFQKQDVSVIKIKELKQVDPPKEPYVYSQF